MVLGIVPVMLPVVFFFVFIAGPVVHFRQLESYAPAVLIIFYAKYMSRTRTRTTGASRTYEESY